MRILFFSTLALSLAIGMSCGNKKKKKQESNKVEETNKYTTEKGSTVWVMLADMNEKYPSDPFTLIDAHVDDMNKLHLTVEYGGGCKTHEFKIFGSNAILKSLPAQRPVMIVHNANSDECRAIIREEILVDISDFAYAKEQDSEIILLLDGQRLSYKYQDPKSNDK
jgi:AAA15 family ATPase/GTPase